MIAGILLLGEDISIEERVDIIENARGIILVDSKGNINMRGDVIGHVLCAFKGVNLRERKEVSSITKNLMNRGVPNVFCGMIIEAINQVGKSERADAREVQEALKGRIYACVESLMADRKNAKKVADIATFINRKRALFGMSGEDPLISFLLYAQAQMDPNFQGTDNIYAVHSELLEKKQEIVKQEVASVGEGGV